MSGCPAAGCAGSCGMKRYLYGDELELGTGDGAADAPGLALATGLALAAGLAPLGGLGSAVGLGVGPALAFAEGTESGTTEGAGDGVAASRRMTSAITMERLLSAGQCDVARGPPRGTRVGALPRRQPCGARVRRDFRWRREDNVRRTRGWFPRVRARRRFRPLRGRPVRARPRTRGRRSAARLWRRWQAKHTRSVHRRPSAASRTRPRRGRPG